jgi:hypothetical protein
MRDYDKNPEKLDRKKTDYVELGFQKGDILNVLDREKGDPSGEVAVIVGRYTLHIEGQGEGSASTLIGKMHDLPAVNGTLWFSDQKFNINLWHLKQIHQEKTSKLKAA